jgi:3-hydroxyisobutyrate dehydrogenase
MHVGFIGLGSMGGDQVRCLIAGNLDVTVYDVHPPAMQVFLESARLAESIAVLATSSDVVCVCVRDDQQVRDILEGSDGLLAHMNPESVVLIHSTVSPETVRELGRQAKSRSIDLLDAAVSRTRMDSREPFLAVMVGGSASALERVRPILNAYATDLFHAGGLGAGMALKIINNLVTWSSIVTTAQAFRLAEVSDVDRNALHGVMTANGNFTRVSNMFSSIFMGAKVDRSFLESQLGIGDKDLALVEKLAWDQRSCSTAVA